MNEKEKKIPFERKFTVHETRSERASRLALLDRIRLRAKLRKHGVLG